MKTVLFIGGVFSFVFGRIMAQDESCLCNSRALRQLYDLVDDTAMSPKHQWHIKFLESMEKGTEGRNLGKKSQSCGKKGKKEDEPDLDNNGICLGEEGCTCWSTIDGSLIDGDSCVVECCSCYDNGGFDGRNNRLMKEKETSKDNEQPWLSPSVKKEMNMIAANPGIWEIPNFVDNELADKIMDVIKSHGDEHGLFRPCDDVGDSYGKSNSAEKRCTCHPKESKKCMRFWPTETSKTQQDKDVMVELMDKIKLAWAVQDIEQRDYFGVQHVIGGCDPMDFHTDAIKTERPVSTIQTVTLTLYLTDGGAGLVFPQPNITIVPKKGTAITWLNTHSDGSTNVAAHHGVQATPDDWDERMMLAFRFTASPEDMLEAATKAASSKE